ncbi:MAG: hypothetical protein CL429_04055 [Acidimicrobiaceae bacterium]|nr:hypothetical protein [Acidimicrobiaceae bacterium]|tara:strand:+ start:236 stop:847 length:612 start_codon:yes stop_codon:yes gene_type:complete
MVRSYKVKIDRKALDSLKVAMEGFTDEDLTNANRVAARAALIEIKKYHRDFAASGKWFNKNSKTWGPDRKRTGWDDKLVRKWRVDTVTKSGAILSNDHPHFASKLKDQTIKPRGSYPLTIPFHPAAHGRTVKQFKRKMGVKVFRKPGKRNLYFTQHGKLKVAYLLRDEVKMKKWPGAMPPDEVIAKPYVQKLAKELLHGMGLD